MIKVFRVRSNKRDVLLGLGAIFDDGTVALRVLVREGVSYMINLRDLQDLREFFKEDGVVVLDGDEEFAST